MRKLALIFTCIIMICSCTHWNRQEFSADGTIKLEVGGKAIFTYDALSCQMSYNSTTGTFRAMTDNASDYFTVAFRSIPSSVGERITADLSWTTANDIIERKDVALEVLRLEGDKVWLRNQSGQIALVVRLLV